MRRQDSSCPAIRQGPVGVLSECCRPLPLGAFAQVVVYFHVLHGPRRGLDSAAFVGCLQVPHQVHLSSHLPLPCFKGYMAMCLASCSVSSRMRNLFHPPPMSLAQPLSQARSRPLYPVRFCCDAKMACNSSTFCCVFSNSSAASRYVSNKSSKS